MLSRTSFYGRPRRTRAVRWDGSPGTARHPFDALRAQPRRDGLRLATCILLLALAHAAAPARAQDPFADAIESLVEGTNGGFNAELLPDVVLGPPRGTGLLQGSFDVLALGIGGAIVLRFDEPICDGPGVDFTIFENAFHNGSLSGPIFDELGFVAASEDGETFVEFPHDADTKMGLAGLTPVLSHPDNGISPIDPEVAGGDSFDLSIVGLGSARFIRITDVAGQIADFGDLPPFLPAPNAGFDLDAVAAIHSCGDEPSPTPTHTPIAGVTATATAPPKAATVTPTANQDATPATHTMTPAMEGPATATPILDGDVDGDGRVDPDDVAAVIREIFDGDDALEPRSDANGDLRITAADLTFVSARRTE